MSVYEVIIYEKSQGIGYITLNRPKALNAYNIRMRDELYEVLGAVGDDTEVEVVILKGAGEKAFCAGADLTEFLTAPSPVFARQARFERDVWGRLWPYAYMQLGLADCLHLFAAHHLGCTYFGSLDSDFRRVKDTVKRNLDIQILSSPEEIIQIF